MLDMLSVQTSADRTWAEREPKAFWRGRDSRRERLHLVSLSRKHPDLLNASLTNFFFHREEEEIYGPKEKHISFFKFFDVKTIFIPVLCFIYVYFSCHTPLVTFVVLLSSV